FVQLRDDGDLLFTADEHFHGTVNFAYTVSTDDDQLATASVAVNVTPVEDDPMPVDLALDQTNAHSAPSDASAIAYDGQGSHATNASPGQDDSGEQRDQPQGAAGQDEGRDASGSGENEHQQQAGAGTGADGRGEHAANASTDAADTSADARGEHAANASADAA